MSGFFEATYIPESMVQSNLLGCEENFNDRFQEVSQTDNISTMLISYYRNAFSRKDQVWH